MNSCKTCGNAIFDALWGEYKCSEHETTIYEFQVDCPYYVKGTPKESKENANYEARTEG